MSAAERLFETVSAKLRRTGSRGPAEIDPVTALRDAARELERDLAAIEAMLVTAASRAREMEARAMAAIRVGNDTAARNALRERQIVVEASERLEADAAVLRAMVEECHAVLAQHGGDAEQEAG